MIQTKRVYDPPSATDGVRVLIDRLWPRGVTKEGARVDSWRRELAPSQELRTWFGHEPKRFPRFRERYRMELLRRRDALVDLALASERGPMTLVYAARDAEHSNAAVLRELLEEIASGGPRRVGAPRSRPRRIPRASRRRTPSRRPPARRDRR